MAAYKITPKVTLQFNIYNLMDKLYYESAYTNWAVPAASRTFALTLRGHTDARSMSGIAAASSPESAMNRRRTGVQPR